MQATFTPIRFKVYTALLTQTSTNAPVATVLENTLGGTVVWARTGPGAYTATLTANKTIVFATPTDDAASYAIAYSWTSANVVTLLTSLATLGIGEPADDVLADSPIEIRVYY